MDNRHDLEIRSIDDMTKSERIDELMKAIAGLKADARAAGLTDEDIDAELIAWKAERRSRLEG